jgi:hypothetical protein
MDFNVGFGLFLLAVGLFGAVAAAMNLESFMSTGKVGLISRVAGRLVARVMVGLCAGCALLGGVSMMVSRS